MYIKEQAIGSGDIAQVESICNRLMIAKLLKEVKGEIPDDYQFYQEVSGGGGYYFYGQDDAAGDFQQGIELLDFGYVEITDIDHQAFSYCMKIFLNSTFDITKLDERTLFDSDHMGYDYLVTKQPTHFELLYNDFMAMPGELLRKLAKLGGYI